MGKNYNADIFAELLGACNRLGKITQAHLYCGGYISIDVITPDGGSVDISVSVGHEEGAKRDKAQGEQCGKK